MRSSVFYLQAGFFLLAMLCGGSVFAWGFGDLQLQSALGQPFRAKANLVGSNNTFIERHCFSANLVSYDGVPLGRIILDVKEGSPDISISGVPPVNEPAAKFILTHSCKPTMQREYPILLDPPFGNLAGIAASSSVRQTQTSNRLNDLPAAARSPETSEKPKKSSQRPSSAQILAIDESIAPQTAQDAAPAKKRKKEKAAVAVAPANVLRLGGSESAVTDLPGGGGDGLRLAMSYGLSGVIPAAADNRPAQAPTSEAATSINDVPTSDAANASALQALLQKINVLENKTKELRKLNATQLLALQDAKKEPPLTASLTLLYVLLLAAVLAIAWLIWRMRKIRAESEYSSWQQIVPDHDAQDHDPQMESRHFADQLSGDAVANGALAVVVAENVDKNAKSNAKSNATTNAISGNKLAEGPAASGEHDFEEHFYSHDKPKIATAEELSDEVQEAEFWVHMNQPLRAIDILEAKSGEDNPVSPLIWLNLFDLYRVVGDKAKYEALGKRFKGVFNGRVIPWDEPLPFKRPRDLEDFPEVMARIVTLWPTDAVLPYLEKLLVDERDGNREGFDLAAFRDILFLSNIAHKIQLLKKFEKPPADYPGLSIL